jgi:hypothetical protein
MTRIAVLSDVHGNTPALAAVLASKFYPLETRVSPRVRV